LKILMISFSNCKKDGRLIELKKVCKMIGETIVISQTGLKDECEEGSITYVSRRHLNYLSFILFCIKWARLFGKVDMVFADNRAAIIPAMLCKGLLRARFAVYDSRELYVLKEVKHFRGKVGCIVEKLWVRKFSLIICANAYRAELMKKLFKLQNTPLVFENIRRLEVNNEIKNIEDAMQTVDITNDNVSANSEDIVQCPMITKDKYASLKETQTVNIICSSGCLLERKSDVLARAVCELGERFKLYLVGISDEKARKAVDEIKDLYHTDNIAIIDTLDKNELKALIGKCDIGIVSYGSNSLNEKYCASGKIYEYLFEGLPVVTTCNPTLKAMCDTHYIGISDDEFISGIKEVSDNLEFYRNNVKAYISTVDINENNKKLAKEICLSLGIKEKSSKKDYNSFLFITGGYPTEGKQLYTFLDALVCKIADLGLDCTVIYPVSLTHFILHKEKLPPKEWTRTTTNGSNISVFCPRIITLSNGKILHKIRSLLNYGTFKHRVNRTIQKKKLIFDVIYGHFIQPSGFVAAELGELYSVPSCVAYGENTSYNIDVFGLEKSRKMIRDITACISVSSDNTRFLVQNEIIPEDKIATIPNAVNRGVFFPREKALMRFKYSIPQESFVVAFVGYFTDIKGSLRLSKALDKTSNVSSIFIGSGALKPNCKNIVFLGTVPHDEIPELLSAADIFVLPTIAEGCCNAIIEALSCGLPIVSSNLPFNDDILNDNFSIRIDTTDIDAIAGAICDLRDDDELRIKMRREALKAADNFDIKVRAERIIEWIRYCDKCRDSTATEMEL